LKDCAARCVHIDLFDWYIHFGFKVLTFTNNQSSAFKYVI
jgi:endogenous inhibitor of DNA gyrase (YacG/DUF329 family)